MMIDSLEIDRTAMRGVEPRALRDAVERLVLQDSAYLRLEDVAPYDSWRHSILSEQGHLLVAAALSGSLAALRSEQITVANFTWWLDSRVRHPFTTVESSVAARWMVQAIGHPEDRQHELALVASTLAARGWLREPVIITSLIRSIFVIAAHARAWCLDDAR